MESPAVADQEQSSEEQPSLENVPGLKLLSILGFKLQRVSPKGLRGTFVVGENSTQPSNVLSGGVSAYLAETLASMGAQVASGWQRAAGIELNINHLAAVSAGSEVLVQAAPLSLGRRVHVWEVRFQVQPQGRLAAISRVTVIVGLPGADSTAGATKLLKSFKSKL